MAEFVKAAKTHEIAPGQSKMLEVNGKKIKANYVVQPNDLIEITLPYLPDKEDVKPENIPLDILYEDNYLMIVNKPAGMVTHPAYKNYSGTLVNALMYYMGDSAAKLPRLNGDEDEGGDERAGIVHRLDKETSGCLILAKTPEAFAALQAQFKSRSVKKTYTALVHGLLLVTRNVKDVAWTGVSYLNPFAAASN